LLGFGEELAFHNSGLEELPDQVNDVLVSDASFDKAEELAVLDRIKIAPNISLDHIVMFVTGVEEGHHDRDGIHGASTFPKPIGMQTEVCFKDRVEDCSECFLHEAVSER
jgi:hypothetical protein